MASSRREYFHRTRKVRMRELGHSRPGWIGLGFGSASVLLFFLAVTLSLTNAGEEPFYVGSLGLVALIFSAGGLVLGIMGTLEEKVRPIPPRTAIVIGAIMTVLLLILYLYGF